MIDITLTYTEKRNVIQMSQRTHHLINFSVHLRQRHESSGVATTQPQMAQVAEEPVGLLAVDAEHRLGSRYAACECEDIDDKIIDCLRP